MVEIVINNIRPRRHHKFIFVVPEKHLSETDLGRALERAAPGSEVIPIEYVTEGAACTVLLARDLIDNDESLMIANSDQYIEVDIEDYLGAIEATGTDGLIMTFVARHPKWSYVRCDDSGRVTEVAEKQVISNQATVGIYNFLQGRDFVRAADQMIAKNLRVNGEFYVAPVFNEFIAAGAKVGTYDIGTLGAGMHGLGVPEDLVEFLRSPASREAVRRSACLQTSRQTDRPSSLVL